MRRMFVMLTILLITSLACNASSAEGEQPEPTITEAIVEPTALSLTPVEDMPAAISALEAAPRTTDSAFGAFENGLTIDASEVLQST